ncbi:hypothetical protein GIB67_037786 [Kingdonia uniflora]|uniref:Uncharacterized protein n=1 Tax=Kingdonia uniflora TaxID=39325 RepID=A0A7J7LV04_9MAGN|nr:hypothetical protein GIB67_037786 [Kingdonia uniflora]
MEAFKSLKDACIDKSLIKQGVDLIVVNEDGGTGTRSLAHGAMGPENFLSFVSLNFDPEKLSEASVWQFPILKQQTILLNSFKGLQKALCSALRDDPDMRGASAHDFSSVLTDILLGSSSDGGGSLQSTIGEFASISDKNVVNKLFTTTMKNLLKVTQNAVERGMPKSSSTMQDASEERKGSIIGSFLTEIILALKEANKKTRNRAYDILVQIGHASGDEEQGGKKEICTNSLTWLDHTKIFSQFGDEDSENSDTEIGSGRLTVSSEFSSNVFKLRSRPNRRALKISPEEFFDQLEDNPLDLLDPQRLSRHLGEKLKRDTSSNPDTDTRSHGGSLLSLNFQDHKKCRKMSDFGWAYTGKEYASKKEGGNLKEDKLGSYELAI